MSVRGLLKLNKGNKIYLGSLKAVFCKSLTEFYQISLKILPYLTDFSSQLMACMNTVSSAIKHFTMFSAYTNINQKFIYREAMIYVNDNILQ